MTLLDCTVLSLRDARVYYPCCKGCCCRIEPDVRDTSRWRCARCGYSCARELVDYRYRLSVRVTRDQRIFGITVFGPCLNPYFGIPACGLKRLVESLEGPSEATMRSTVLARAVEDCFIGRCFFFGIKGTDPGVMPWSSLLNKGRDGPVHLTASQMILPVPTGLSGCSVVSYYRRLLQKTAEFELISADPSKSLRRPVSALLLTPQSPHPKALSISSFACSLPSLQHHNSSLSSTLPWQQSPGLVTSSAESSFEDFVDRDHHHRAESRNFHPTPQLGMSLRCQKASLSLWTSSTLLKLDPCC
ncbi:DNA damage-induced apoptosis suppressor protein [Synchiropus picturatus]